MTVVQFSTMVPDGGEKEILDNFPNKHENMRHRLDESENDA